MVGLIDSEGSKWEFNNTITWHDFQETLTEERSKQLWEEASKHRGEGMEKGVDMSVSSKHYNRLVKEGKTAEASALMSIQSGALWSPQRLQEAGIEAESGVHKCPLCGKEGTDEGHLFWECPKVCQNPDARLQKTNRYCDEYRRSGLSMKCYWWRGIQPLEETTPIRAPRAHTQAKNHSLH